MSQQQPGCGIQQPATYTDMRAAWIATCIFWAWALGSIVWVPFTLGLSLFGLLLAGGSVWAIWIPIGASTKTVSAHGAPSAIPPAQPQYGYQAPPVMPPANPPHQAGQ